MKASTRHAGFTVVELIVTIVVAGMFISIVSSMNGFVVNTATSAHRFEMASNLAYNNLRIYANGQKASDFGFLCNGDDASDTGTFNDGAGVKATQATGTLLINTTSSTSINDLPPPVIQTVNALAPYGCGNTIKGMPIRIVSTVTYGSPAKKVVHATYVSP